MARYNSKRITWKQDVVARTSEALRLPPVVRVTPREDGLVLVPGQMFMLNTSLELVQENKFFQKPPVPYAVESYYQDPRYVVGITLFPRNSYAIFLGRTRVDEMSGTQVRSLLRATFFVNGARLIPTNLNHLNPVV
jgi:hypothetical protein